MSFPSNPAFRYNLSMRTYYVYILTDRYRRLLYTGMTNNLERRLHEHRTQNNLESYTARYGIHYLAYFEVHALPSHAYRREKEIKLMSREDKDRLIQAFEQQESGCPPHLVNPYAPPPKVPPTPRWDRLS